MKFLSARHSSGYKNRNWNTTSHYSLFSLDFISRFALWSQHFSLWRGNSFPLCTWKESQKSIWKCFISRSCWELGLAGCDWGMQQLTFFLDSRDLICVTWCYHTACTPATLGCLQDLISQLLTCPLPGNVCFLCLCVRRRWPCMRTVCTRGLGTRVGPLLTLAPVPWVPLDTPHIQFIEWTDCMMCVVEISER